MKKSTQNEKRSEFVMKTVCDQKMLLFIDYLPIYGIRTGTLTRNVVGTIIEAMVVGSGSGVMGCVDVIILILTGASPVSIQLAPSV